MVIDVRLTTEVALAAAVFVAMCLVILLRSPQLLEPDDYAYRASIIALSQGHLLLTNAQYFALKAQLSAHGGPGIEQWVHLRSGRWISQKNPGYPFFAVVFQWLHALRASSFVLRGVRLRRSLLWRTSVARSMGRGVRHRSLLLLRRDTTVRLASDDVHVHRRLADRRSSWTSPRRAA